jgi:hypothetical protein
MEKFLVRKNLVSNIRNAKAILGLFSVLCFTIAGFIFVDAVTKDVVKNFYVRESLVLEEILPTN